MADDRQGINLGFGDAPAEFRGPTQIARAVTEQWAEEWLYCPNCASPRLKRYEANRPVADFFCGDCDDQFELKSQKKPFGNKIANGAYSTKIERLTSDQSPNLILLEYSGELRQVRNVTFIPKRFFVPSIIEKRKPLAKTARRAGWVGSNIMIGRIPALGRISAISSGKVRNRDDVIAEWSKSAFFDGRSAEARGWLVEVLNCVDQLGREFGLTDVYLFEDRLSTIYPDNRNVRPKIRQKLQVLRDGGFIEFLGNGRYQKLQ